MIYGIQAAKDVKLSNIAHALNEHIPLIKIDDNLIDSLAKVYGPFWYLRPFGKRQDLKRL